MHVDSTTFSASHTFVGGHPTLGVLSSPMVQGGNANAGPGTIALLVYSATEVFVTEANDARKC